MLFIVINDTIRTQLPQSLFLFTLYDYVGFSPVSLATHLALVIPGASHISLGILSIFSAFLHNDSIKSADNVVIPGCTDRHM